jgi:prefoldin subunit 5
MSERDLKQQLAQCEAQLRRVKEDRDHLRDASSDFADLAERLSEQIRQLRQELEELQREQERSGS